MKDISQVTACFIDHGLFLPLALRMAEEAKRVLYWTPYEEGFSTIRKGCLGRGFETMERCQDFWKAKSEIDLFVFPDIEHSGLQLELESQGFPVWGSRNGDSLELNREKFLKVLGRVGLEVPEHTICVGLEELREHLDDLEDQYVKISRWRGDVETFHWWNKAVSEFTLDLWAVKFGPFKRTMHFLVFPAIETDLEIGGDTYGVDGRFPETMLHGLEWKDKGYFGAVTPRDEMPEPIQDVLDAFAPEFRKERVRNEFSAEVRVQGKRAFFIDPTLRGGLPSTASQMMLWKNFPEIMWAGANGELVEPEPAGQYAAECIVSAKAAKDIWTAVEVPQDLQPWLKLGSCCQDNGVVYFPPGDGEEHDIGWLVAIGDTPEETINGIKAKAKALTGGMSADTDCLADILKEVETEEKEGIEFGDQEVPPPEIVLEEAK